MWVPACPGACIPCATRNIVYTADARATTWGRPYGTDRHMNREGQADASTIGGTYGNHIHL